jgi:hypothetical protein
MTQYFPCSSYPDKKLWQTHGADALTYVRFLRMCFLCCLVTTIISCSILLPLNLSGWPLHIVTHTHHRTRTHAGANVWQQAIRNRIPWAIWAT